MACRATSPRGSMMLHGLLDMWIFLRPSCAEKCEMDARRTTPLTIGRRTNAFRIVVHYASTDISMKSLT